MNKSTENQKIKNNKNKKQQAGTSPKTNNNVQNKQTKKKGQL